MQNIGIIGNGFVGDAVAYSLQSHCSIFIHDTDKTKSKYNLNDVVHNCDIIFICVPTPMSDTNEIDLTYIHDVFDKIKQIDSCEEKIFVIKSTVIPGTCRSLEQKYNVNIVMNPEFLTERFARHDIMNPRSIVIGGNKKFRDILHNIYKNVYDEIIQSEVSVLTDFKYTLCTHDEAEMIKYTTNVFFACKVTIMNELYDICQAANIDYKNVIQGVISDGRVFPMHVDVPGHDGSRGFGGKCFPKDINALNMFSNSLNITSDVLQAVISKNKKYRDT